MKNRKIVTIFALILLSLFININVFAAGKHVYVDDENKDLYTDGTFEGVTFDSSTNTLTLTNYSGGHISFNEFNNETVYVILNGNNTITNGDGSKDAISAINGNEGYTNFEITGNECSSLNINTFNYGIFTRTGYLKIKNANITISNTEYGIYSQDDEVILIDSKINISNTSFGVASDYKEITFNNVVYTGSNLTECGVWANSLSANKLTLNFSDSDSAAFYINEETTNSIENSNITIDSAKYLFFSTGEVTLDMTNTTCNITDTEYGLFGNNLTANAHGCTFNMDNIDYFVVGKEILLDNCTVDCNIVGNEFISASDSCKVKDSNLTFTDDVNSIFEVTDELVIENTDFEIEDASLFAFADLVSIKDSNIHIIDVGDFLSEVSEVTIETSDIKIDNGNPEGVGVFSAGSIDIIKSNLDVHSTVFCIHCGTLGIDDSNVHLKSDSEAVILVMSDDMNSVNVKNASLAETGYSLYNTIVEGNDILSYFDHEPEASYTFDDFNDGAQELHFIAASNPNTFDISVLYIIIGILSVIGISIAKFDLDLLKNK